MLSRRSLTRLDSISLSCGGAARRSRPLIEVRIDRRDLAAVTVDDCARVSRALESRLDGSGLVSPEYVLQVSSPGERPLRTAAEWRRFVAAQWANVLAPQHGGRIEGKILAVEGESGSEVVIVSPKSGVERRIPLADVTEARLAFHL